MTGAVLSDAGLALAHGRLTARRFHLDAARRDPTLDAISALWHEVQAVDVLREAARRVLRLHSLRAGDSLQLAAAFMAAENRPSTLEFVCLDDRLGGAARREGFHVLEV